MRRMCSNDVVVKAVAPNSLNGQTMMKLAKGKANPALVGEILERKLKG